MRFFGGNIENPGSSSYFPYVSITGVNNHVSMAGTTITLDNTSAWTDVPFKVGVNNKMSFVDILIPINNFPFETTSGIRAFCTGAGLVQATNSAYAQTSGGWKIPWASNANMLRNGDFELGTTAGWTVTTSGAAPTTFTAVTSNVHLGTYAG